MLSSCVVSLFALAAAPLAVFAQDNPQVTGAGGNPDGVGVPYRKNINDVQKAGGAQWDLYIQALNAMHNANADDPLSFFQIAGIHGKPFIEYAESGAENATDWLGYCPHNEKLFASWHRPYVLLYEQTLVGHAKTIAQTYPDKYRSQYTQAAATLRAAFWDWAGDSEVPPCTVPEKMTIQVPDGDGLKSKDVDNPFYTFVFPQKALDGAYGDWDSENRKQIYRCPAPDSYPDSANNLLSKRPYKEWMYDAFTTADDFATFATTGEGGISLEQVHNGIHWDGACAGQFLAAEFSAFDPLFMLHHAQVDRLWAYWEAMSPNDRFFEVPYPGGGRFASPKGTSINADSSLQPFFQKNGEFHTTRDVQDYESMGYTYDKLEYWKKSDQQMQEDARELINTLYGDGSTSSKMIRRSEEKTRYFVRIDLKVQEVERPCSIEVYMGDELAGSLVIMAQPPSGKTHGSFSIDKAIEKQNLEKGDAEKTVDAAEDVMNVVIARKNGTHIDPASVPSLNVEIENVNMTPPKKSNEFPSYGKKNRRPAKKVMKSIGLDIKIGGS